MYFTSCCWSIFALFSIVLLSDASEHLRTIPAISAFRPQNHGNDVYLELDPNVKQALLDFFFATNGPHWTNRDLWNVDPNYCNWWGVACNGTNVAAILLKGNNLSGTLPSSLGAISTLQYIDISQNHIYGTIPQSIGKLVALEMLEISNNQLRGIIPSSIGYCKSLFYLSASENYLESPLPDELFTAPLQTLRLSRNQLTGTIPASIGAAKSLIELDLSYNKLSGTLPEELLELTNLTSLVLNNNKLTGEIFSQAQNITRLINLEKLVLSHNRFSASFQDTYVWTLTNLRTLLMDHNNFTGDIHPMISNLEHCSVIDVSFNYLHGDIPLASLYHMYTEGALAFFDASGNPSLRSSSSQLPPWLQQVQFIMPDDSGKFECSALAAFGNGAMIFRIDPHFFSYAHCRCSHGYYGLPGKTCYDCPAHAHCEGNSLVYRQGFYATIIMPAALTDGLQIQPIKTPVVVVQSCPDAALGKNSACNPDGNVTITLARDGSLKQIGRVCTDGTSGRFCSQCECKPGESCWYRRGNTCMPCAVVLNNQGTIILVACLITALVVIVTVVTAVKRRIWQNINIAYNIDSEPPRKTFRASGYIKIGLFFTQTLAKVLYWPNSAVITTAAAVFDITNGRLIELGVSCLSPILAKPAGQMLIYSVLPLVKLAIVIIAQVIVWLIGYGLKKCRRPNVEEDYVNDDLLLRTEGKVKTTPSAIQTVVTVLLTILQVFYFGLLLDAFSVFNCVSDGTERTTLTYVQSIPWLSCSSAEWQHTKTVATFAAIGYSIALPLGLAIVTCLYRGKLGKDPAFLKTVAPVISSYKPTQFWFDLAVTGRRFLLALLLGFVPIGSSFRFWSVSAVLLLALLLQVWVQPYASSEENKLEEAGLGILILIVTAHRFASDSDTNPLAIISLCAGIVYLIVLFIIAMRNGFYRSPSSPTHLNSSKRRYNRTR